jgi:hypothetical protein
MLSFDSGRDIAEDFVGVRRERRNEDEADDVVDLGGRIADERPAVGVPDQQHRTIDLLDDALQVCGVSADAPKRDRRGFDGVSLPLEPFDHPIPTRPVGEGSVYEHDRRLHLVSPSSAQRAEGGPELL